MQQSRHYESYPNAAPKPSTIPKLCVKETNLAITPEKIPIVVNNDRAKKNNIKKKVMFKENQIKDFYKECPLGKPSINTTSLLTQEIDKNRQKTLDVSKALQEIQLSDSVQNTLREEITSVLNYKLTDRKFNHLPSLDVPDEKIVLKTRAKFKDKNKDYSLKPDIMDIYFPEDIITERAKTDFKIDFQQDSDIEEKENFNFLFDLYECQEFLPHSNFHL